MFDKITGLKIFSLKFPLETVIYVCLLLIYFRPANYVMGEMAYKGFSMLLIVIGIAVLFFCILQSISRFTTSNKYFYAPSLPVIILILLYFWNLIGSSLVNVAMGNSMKTSSALISGFTAIGFILLSDYGLFHNPKRYVGCFAAIGSIMCLLNDITMFLLKNSGGLKAGAMSSRGFGIDTNNFYLLAEDNATFFWAWPVFIAVWIYYYLYDNSKRMKTFALLYSIITVVAYMYVWSVLAMVCFIVTMAALILCSKKLGNNKKRYSKNKHQISKMGIGFFAAMIFNYEMSVNLIFKKYSYYIETYLHKTATLNGRVDIWARALKYINRAPLIGYGYEPNEVSIVKIGINHTHNILLETMYRGGVIGLILFVAFFILMGIKGKKAQKVPIYFFLIICVTLFLFMTTFEFAYYRYPHIFVFVILCHPEIFRKRSFSVEQAQRRKKMRWKVRIKA